MVCTIVFCFKGVVEISFLDDALVVIEGDSPLTVCTQIILPPGKDLGFNITAHLNASSGINAGMQLMMYIVCFQNMGCFV